VNAPTNLRALLQSTTARLNAAHIDSPAATARALLSHALGRPREWLAAHDDGVPDGATLAVLERLVGRVLAHEPLAYILGYREFYGVELHVDERVLIPRPETEMLVELALEHLRTFTPPGPPLPREGSVDVSDVGTGSGAVAIAISTHAPDASLIATDVSPDALDVARANAQRCGVSQRIRFVQSDLLDCVKSCARVITANLPYVTEEEIEALPPEIQSHEPRVALDGGADGLVLVRRLLAQLDAHLLPNGMAVFEIGASQGAAALQAAQATLPGWQAELRKDLAKLDRVLYVRKPDSFIS
jgi:release factor glutamine methyltransferase